MADSITDVEPGTASCGTTILTVWSIFLELGFLRSTNKALLKNCGDPSGCKKIEFF